MSTISKKKCDVCGVEWDNKDMAPVNTICISIDYRYDIDCRDVCFNCLADPKVAEIMGEIVEQMRIKDAEILAKKNVSNVQE